MRQLSSSEQLGLESGGSNCVDSSPRLVLVAAARRVAARQSASKIASFGTLLSSHRGGGEGGSTQYNYSTQYTRPQQHILLCGGSIVGQHCLNIFLIPFRYHYLQ